MRWIAVAIGIAALLWLAVLGMRPDDRARDPTLDLAAALIDDRSCVGAGALGAGMGLGGAAACRGRLTSRAGHFRKS